MNEWSGPLWNDCGACNYTRRTTSRGSLGKPNRWCLWCEIDARRAMSHLASSLRIAAAIALGFELGRQFGFASCSCGDYLTDEDWALIEAAYWHPNCHRPALGWVTP